MFRALIAFISSSVSAKSKTAMFSSSRFSEVVLGIAIVFLWTAHLSAIYAGVFLYFSAGLSRAGDSKQVSASVARPIET